MNKRQGMPIAVLAVGMVLLRGEAALAASVTLRVATLSAAQGSTASVPIDVVGASDIGAMHVELVYDVGVLTFDAVRPGKLAGDALLDSGADTPGRLIISLATLKAIEGDGTIATARFKVVGQQGQSSPLTLESTAAWEESTLREILVKNESGVLNVGARGIPWWLLGLAALLLLLVVIVVFARRGRRPAEQTVAQTARPQQSMYCSKCGNPSAAGAKFCPHCGNPLAT